MEDERYKMFLKKTKWGISWGWIEGLDEETAKELHEELERRGKETRGIYKDKDGTYAIRWR